MRIVLIGPPGSGKGTQAYFITKRYNIPCISVGDILRDVMINNHSNLSNIIKDTVNSGCLVSNELVIDLVRERIENCDCNNGFILDGFPRTITQAYAIKDMNISIDFVFNFFIAAKLIIQRIAGRYLHIPSGRIYHSILNPPKKKGYDDITGELLMFREDDSKLIIRKRLAEYYCYTIPVIDFYRKESLVNSNLQYFSINCNKSIFDIQVELDKILK